MKAKLKRQFDGYHFSRRLIGVYNPFSILRAFNEMWIDDYWFKTGSPTYLVRLLAHDNEHINELVGKYYTTQDFDDYKADVERPLPMIYQSGYLTVKKYKRLTNSYLLDFQMMKYAVASLHCSHPATSSQKNLQVHGFFK